MLPKFDPKQLSEQLSHLPSLQVAAFCASCCERLYGNYMAFQNQTGWGESSELRKAIDLIWKFAFNEIVLQDISDEIEVSMNSVEANTPDTEDFETVLVSLALDAASAVFTTLAYLKDQDPKMAVEVASFAIDTVDMFVQVNEGYHPQDPQLEDKIVSHPFMIKELNFQKQDLILLTDNAENSIQATKRLFALACDRGHSNVELK